jgi:hypothetical protein
LRQHSQGNEEFEESRSPLRQHPVEFRHHRQPLRIPPKLSISPPGDKLEKEADHVADAVTRMPEPRSRAVSERDVDPPGGPQRLKSQEAVEDPSMVLSIDFALNAKPNRRLASQSAIVAH